MLEWTDVPNTNDADTLEGGGILGHPQIRVNVILYRIDYDRSHNEYGYSSF